MAYTPPDLGNWVVPCPGTYAPPDLGAWTAIPCDPWEPVVACRLLIDNGSEQLDLQSSADLSIQFATVTSGGSILRFLDGSARRQSRYRKQQITISGAAYLPLGITEYDFDGQLTVRIENPFGDQTLTCLAPGWRDTWNYRAGESSWELTLVEQ